LIPYGSNCLPINHIHPPSLSDYPDVSIIISYLQLSLLIVSLFVFLALQPIVVVGLAMWRVWGRGEVCTGFWWGSLRERAHWRDPDIDGRIILRRIFRKWEGVVGTRWSGLRIGTGGGHL
jgi:hypothetical protein